jgi:hypothetical protein
VANPVVAGVGDKVREADVFVVPGLSRLPQITGAAVSLDHHPAARSAPASAFLPRRSSDTSPPREGRAFPTGFEALLSKLMQQANQDERIGL